jgi:hypothetical protein
MDFKKLLEGKSKSKMNPSHKEAKMGVLSGLKGEMSKLMGEDVKGLKSVSVSAPDKEGLKAGLDTAEDMIEPASSEESMPEASAKDKVLEMCEAMSNEELDELIAELQSKKSAEPELEE